MGIGLAIQSESKCVYLSENLKCAYSQVHSFWHIKSSRRVRVSGEKGKDVILEEKNGSGLEIEGLGRQLSQSNTCVLSASSVPQKISPIAEFGVDTTLLPKEDSETEGFPREIDSSASYLLVHSQI